jgi:hypothetical protein
MAQNDEYVMKAKDGSKDGSRPEWGIFLISVDVGFDVCGLVGLRDIDADKASGDCRRLGRTLVTDG